MWILPFIIVGSLRSVLTCQRGMLIFESATIMLDNVCMQSSPSYCGRDPIDNERVSSSKAIFSFNENNIETVK